MVNQLMTNLHYLVAMILFIIGFHTMLTHSNLIKKVIGMNIMETGIFLLFISIGYVRGGSAPIINDSIASYVNPLPSALILTGIVVGVSLTAFSLSMILKIYHYYGTVDSDEIMKIKDAEE
jgi:multicomponent Na+:H+ antiporter subunit C